MSGQPPVPVDLVDSVRASVLAVLLLAGATPRAAVADSYSDREQQLKALGIDDDLRPKVIRAIGVGSHWLAGKLAGSPADPRSQARGPLIVGAGPSVLAALALVHSGTDESIAAAKSSVRRLFVDDRAAAEEIRSQTYQAGIA